MFEKYKKVLKKDYEAWSCQQEDYRARVAQDPRRLKFHLMPPTGWLNDPNGLCQFHGTYHIYYQYTPFEPTGELKLWGHYTTQDFITYREEEPVLFPDTDMDAHGVYSGSAFVENDEIHYFYTGNLKYFDREDYDYINSGRGSNTIACSSRDGYEFSPKELLMTTDDYPEDMSNHVRDPKIIKRGDDYYMVLGARDKEGVGMVLMYRSKDLKQWEYVNRITTKEKFGYMWECPDLFEVDGQLMLVCCPQGVETKGVDYENVHQCTAMKIAYDFDTNEYEIGEIHLVDRGFDFYAPQTFEDEQGRRILIGWMGIPDADYTNPTTEAGWQHALTIPREIFVKDGKFIQKPLEELKQLRSEDKAVCTFYYGQEIILQNVVYEAIVEYNKCSSMRMTLRDGITLSYKDKILTLDLGEYGAGRTTRKVHVDTLRKLQIFADTSSLEIFVNDGEEVFTTRIYQLQGRLSIFGECSGTMTVYPLKSFSIKGGRNEK
jgi:beta-fructofuranosidase